MRKRNQLLLSMALNQVGCVCWAICSRNNQVYMVGATESTSRTTWEFDVESKHDFGHLKGTTTNH